ncbi:MAG: hypothetical protein WDO13_12575 [Verrucomicrobiota bacterium]
MTGPSAATSAQVGLGAIDPNENDSDWGDSFLNLQGIKVQAAYNFTDFLTRHRHLLRRLELQGGLPRCRDPGPRQRRSHRQPAAGRRSGYNVGGATTNPGGTNTGLGTLAGANSVQRVDVDLQWKF